MRKTLLIALSLMFTIGCVQPNLAPVWSLEVTPEAHAFLDDLVDYSIVAEEVERLSGGDVTLSLETSSNGGTSTLVLWVPPADLHPGKYGYGDEGFTCLCPSNGDGVYADRVRDILLVSANPNMILAVMILHEIGHSRGLNHVEEPCAIMNGALDITCEDFRW